MLVKFLNSGDRVSTTIAGSYFKGDGWTGAYYDSDEGRLVFVLFTNCFIFNIVNKYHIM